MLDQNLLNSCPQCLKSNQRSEAVLKVSRAPGGKQAETLSDISGRKPASVEGLKRSEVDKEETWPSHTPSSACLVVCCYRIRYRRAFLFLLPYKTRPRARVTRVAQNTKLTACRVRFRPYFEEAPKQRHRALHCGGLQFKHWNTTTRLGKTQRVCMQEVPTTHM